MIRIRFSGSQELIWKGVSGGTVLQCLNPEQRQYAQEIVLEAQDVTATLTNFEIRMLGRWKCYNEQQCGRQK